MRNCPMGTIAGSTWSEGIQDGRRQPGQQPEHERPRPPPRLHPAETGSDAQHQLIEHTPPAGRPTLGPAATARSSRFSTNRMIRQWPSPIRHCHIVMFVPPGSLPAGRAAKQDAISAQPARKEARMSGEAKAMQPEDVTRLVAERLNAGDAAGVAALYEPQAVLAYPADRPVTGRQ